MLILPSQHLGYLLLTPATVGVHQVVKVPEDYDDD
jgi:hypothetical protein